MSEFRPSKPGERRGGRQKGAANKVTVEIKAAIEHAFTALGGQQDLAIWAAANRDKFYTLMLTKLVPKDIQATVRHITDATAISDNELANIATRGSSDASEAPQDTKGLH